MIVAGHRIAPFHVLALAALVLPTLAIYAPLGLAPLFMVTGVLALALGWRQRPWRAIPREAALVLLALTVWGLASTLWTIEPPVALRTTLGLAGLFAGGLMLVGLTDGFSPEESRRLGLLLAVGVTVALVMAVSELYLRWPMAYFTRSDNIYAIPFSRRMGRGLTIAAIMMVPATVAAWRGGYRGWALAIMVMAAADIVKGETLSAKICLVMAPVAFLAVMRLRRVMVPVIAGVAVALVLAFPLLSLVPPPQRTMDMLGDYIPNSSHHRLTIWTFTARKVLEHPLRGWGMESSRSLPEAEDGDWVVKHYPSGDINILEQHLPLHPHNGPGQIWLELGGVGAVTVCLLIAALTRAMWRTKAAVDAALAGAAFTATVVISCVSYGTWQSWWQGGLWLTAAILAGMSQRRSAADAGDQPAT